MFLCTLKILRHKCLFRHSENTYGPEADPEPEGPVIKLRIRTVPKCFGSGSLLTRDMTNLDKKRVPGGADVVLVLLQDADQGGPPL